MRAFLKIAVAAWMSAAMFVSPLVASLECHRCCYAQSTESPASCRVHHTPDTSLPTCCASHRAANPSIKSETCPSCPSCPKCEARRPSPALASSLQSWKLPVEFVLPLPRMLIDEIANDRSMRHHDRQVFDRSAPPLRVLFCTWQE